MKYMYVVRRVLTGIHSGCYPEGSCRSIRLPKWVTTENGADKLSGRASIVVEGIIGQEGHK